MAREGLITIEVVYALAERQTVIILEIEPGTTAAEAVRLSRLSEQDQAIDARTATIGIHGREVEPGTVLSDGDRVEIYRPLRADPKLARRRRAGRAGTRRTS
jgi:putative ubiquitin-RnfH superfamily antitoxin RatB of RatAB toxin-antitoxin module